MNERLPPIPTPSAQLWQQLRLQYLPVVVFVAGVAAAALLWTQWVAPPTLVGEAEAIRTEVRSAQAGTISGLDIDLLQSVTAGQIIGHVLVSDPRVFQASLNVVKAGIDLMRTTMDPIIGQQRVALDIERLRLEWLGKRVELVSLQGELHQAEATLARTTAMHRTQMVTDEQFEEARNTRDALAAHVAAQVDLIAKMEPGMQTFALDGGGGTGGSAADGLRAAIKQKEEELRLVEAQLGPLPLVAPIDGIVTLVFRRNGERVAPGEPIMQISATRIGRIIGFIRPPLPLEPKAGMDVEVRTRAVRRQMGQATITHVGQQLEPISPTLLAAMRLPVSSIPTEFGLRVLITTPTGLTLRPGEQVDIIIRN